MSSPYFFQSLTAFGNYTTFTPTGSWTTNTTYTGRWYRLGENMFINYKVALGGAPTNTSLTLNLPLVNGATVTIDQTKLLQSGQEARSAILGAAAMNDNNGSFYQASVTQNDSTSVLVAPYVVSATYIVRITTSTTVPFTWASGDDVTAFAVVPITGWSA